MGSKCNQVKKQLTQSTLNQQQKEAFEHYNQLANQVIPEGLNDKSSLAQQLKEEQPAFKKLIKVIKKNKSDKTSRGWVLRSIKPKQSTA